MSPEDKAAVDWVRMSRLENGSWDNQIARLLAEYSYSKRASTSYDTQDHAIPMEYTWTPPTPTLDSDRSSGSRRSSLQSIPSSDFDELPEIPFVSPPLLDQDDNKDDPNSSQTFWSSLIHPPTRSRTPSNERSVALLGEARHRVLSPARCRAPSVSSNASSRSKPAPAKSILSSSSSIRTKTGRSPPSVKFLDMPTIHYETEPEEEHHGPDHDCDYDYDPDAYDERYDTHSSAGSEEKKWSFGFIRQIARRKSRASISTSIISGPYPLWEQPPPSSASIASRTRTTGRPPLERRRVTSLRSVRSSGSLASIRSCGSRLQSYWSWFSGKDP
ncbi:hypothetical protein QCA50_001408 [Cerrena zonata]|uniref:Uncharacterized protein n=1 Tax=Cerrena zonata TaxID=2478898 RepID=A0AAW0GKX0_9APHY